MSIDWQQHRRKPNHINALEFHSPAQFSPMMCSIISEEKWSRRVNWCHFIPQYVHVGPETKIVMKDKNYTGPGMSSFFNLWASNNCHLSSRPFLVRCTSIEFKESWALSIPWQVQPNNPQRTFSSKIFTRCDNIGVVWADMNIVQRETGSCFSSVSVDPCQRIFFRAAMTKQWNSRILRSLIFFEQDELKRVPWIDIHKRRLKVEISSFSTTPLSSLSVTYKVDSWEHFDFVLFAKNKTPFGVILVSWRVFRRR